MLFVDSGDFKIDDISAIYANRDGKYLPNVTVLLDKGIIIYGSLEEKGFGFNLYPEENKTDEKYWYFSPLLGDGSGSPEGNHLGFLYYVLVKHLVNSYLEPPDLTQYIGQMLGGRKSLIRKISTK